MTTHHQTVGKQFDSQANEYLTSQVHSQGPDLAFAKELIEQHHKEIKSAIDIGCGAGHLSYALAPLIDNVTATDSSSAMLDIVKEQAQSKSFINLDIKQCRAEEIAQNFSDIDLICSRYSAHHWTDFNSAIEQIGNAVRTGGYVLIIDIEGEINKIVDTHLQTIEYLRDASHVRNRDQNEWRHALETSGFTIEKYKSWPTRLQFDTWVNRMNTAEDKVDILRQLQLDANQEVKRALSIEKDGSFSPQTGLYWAKKQ
ncbi:class I SAM-dependent DNA methyltransferase [Methylophaga sulfidovorans]|uniref:Ubiquinone/menaquinone biosynthesis C-methylase UbiE n=1 Tax=Methylophaga sulfidovorans TaxID=45496 RepID=A0A1I4BWJ7_9GAMM|nr:class I SAM-dependent methyltransferase [Methylophaga sulfidovorans]SFK73025.1 Ubiquinone/menaquinone biosynthesis C-methylase UbiE [Methylophaga sulfidovorans]